MLKHKRRLACFSSFLSLAFFLTSSKGFSGEYELSWAPDEPPRLIIRKLESFEGNTTKDKIEISRSALLRLATTLDDKSKRKKHLEQLIVDLQYPEDLIGQSVPRQFPPQLVDSVFTPLVELRNKLRKLKDQFLDLSVCETHLSLLEKYYTKFIKQLVNQATSQELWEKYCAPKIKFSLPCGPFRVLQEDALKLSQKPEFLQEPNFHSPHEVLNYLLFPKQKIRNGYFAGNKSGIPFDEEGSFQSSLSITDFLTKIDLASPEERKALYAAISPSSFSRAFIISHLIEPLYPELPPLEVRYVDKQQKGGFIAFTSYSKSSKQPLKKALQDLLSSFTEDAWKPLYGFKNPLYLLQPFMEMQFSPTLRNSLLKLFPPLEVLKYGQALLDTEPRLPLLPLGIERFYERLENLTVYLKDHPHASYGQLLSDLYPFEGYYFQKKIREHPTALAKVHAAFQNQEPDWPSLLKDFFPHHPFNQAYTQRLYGALQANFSEKPTAEEAFYISYSRLRNLLENLDFEAYGPSCSQHLFDLFDWMSQHFSEPKLYFPRHARWKDPLMWREILNQQFQTIQRDKYKTSRLQEAYRRVLHYARALEVDLTEKEEGSMPPGPLWHVLQSTPQEKAILPLFNALIEEEKNFNILDLQQRTLLDIALERKFYNIASSLVERGAGKVISLQTALSFFQNFVHQSNTPPFKMLEKILRKNPSLNWEIFWSLSKKSNKKGMQISTTHQEIAFLSESLVACLFPVELIPRRLKITESCGNSAVAKVTLNPLQSFYFKEAPSFPGIEYAVHRLMQRMIGFGSPFSTCAMINHVPYLISQSVEGKNLREALNEDATLQTIRWNGKKQPLIWDKESFSQFLIMSMIINPEDGRADNYVIEEHPERSGTFRLIAIDSDQAFAPGVARNEQQKTVVQVKCLPFCFPQMRSPIPASVKELFASQEPYDILVAWLGELEVYHEKLAVLKEKKTNVKPSFTLQRTHLDKKTYYGVPFVPKMMGRLYTRMKTVYSLFNHPDTPSNLTHLQLLEKIDWPLAHKYTPRSQESIMDHFRRIETTADQTQSSTSFEAYLHGIEILQENSLKHTISQHKEIGPSRGLREMLTTAKELAWKNMASNLKVFKALLTPEDRAQFIKEKVPFRNLNPVETSAWIQTIVSSDISELFIAHCPILPLESLLVPSFLARLDKLHLEGCGRLETDSFLPLLAQHSVGLQLLNLSGSAFRSFDAPYRYNKLWGMKSFVFKRRQTISFPSLRYLLLNTCKNLQSISLQAPLERLEVRECENLAQVDLQGSILKRLAVEGAVQVSSDWVNEWIRRGTKVTLDQSTSQYSYKHTLAIMPSYPRLSEKSFTLGKNTQQVAILKNILCIPDLKELEIASALGSSESFQLLELLKTAGHLKKVVLSGTIHGDSCIEMLGNHSGLIELELKDLRPLSTIKSCSLLSHLETLRLEGCEPLNDSNFPFLLASNTPHLSLLDLSRTSIEGFKHSTSLQSSHDTKHDKSRILSFPSLTHLILNGCYKLKDIYISAPLEKLAINGCAILEMIELKKERLKELNVAGAGKLSSNWINHYIEKNIHVTLDQNTSHGDYKKTLQLLPQYPRFQERKFLIKDLRHLSALPPLLCLPSLEDITLTYRNQGGVGALEMLELLKNAAWLKKISLNGTMCGNACAQLLSQNKHLTSLELDLTWYHEVVHKTYRDPDIGDKIAHGLVGGFFSIVVGGVIDGLTGGKTDTVGSMLNGTWNSMGDKIEERHISIETHPPSPEAQINLEGAKWLAQNTTLQSLNLNHNNVGDEGARLFAKNTMLRRLSLAHNNISNAAAQDFLKNTTLTELDLSGNGIDKTTLTLINAHIEKNRQSFIPSPELLEDSSSPILDLASKTSLKQVEPSPKIYEKVESNWLYTGLSIDGGGMRGLIPAIMLEHLEEVAERPLYRIFDYVGGTSVGGILSMGIGATLDGQTPLCQMSQLVKLFSEQGQCIFPSQGIWGTLKNPAGLLRSKYDPQPLEGLLKDYFQEAQLSKVLTDVMVTGVKHGTNEALVFDSQAALLDPSQNFYLRSVGRATSAAPTYFPSAQIWNLKRSLNYTINDGGVGLNDPTPLVCARLSNMAAERHLDPHQFFVLSMGTGELMPSYTPSPQAGAGGWVFKNKIGFSIIESAMEAPMHFVRKYIKDQFQGKYLRIQPAIFHGWESPDKNPPEGARQALISELPLDNTSPEFLKLYRVAAKHTALRFFGEKGHPSALVKWLQENTDRKFDPLERIDAIEFAAPAASPKPKVSQKKEQLFQPQTPFNSTRQIFSKNFYSLIFGGKKVKLALHPSPMDGNCGYWSLEIPREQAAQKLHANIHRQEVRTLIAPEIEDMFMELPLYMRNCPIYQKLVQEEKNLDKAAQKCVSETNDLCHRREGEKLNQEELVAYLAALQPRAQSQQQALMRLRNQAQKRQKFEEKKRRYCAQEKTVKNFVTFFIAPSPAAYYQEMGVENWLNYSNVVLPDGTYRTSSADALAFLEGKNLCILNKEGEIQHQYIVPGQSKDAISCDNTLFLLHGQNHFDALKKRGSERKD